MQIKFSRTMSRVLICPCSVLGDGGVVSACRTHMVMRAVGQTVRPLLFIAGYYGPLWTLRGATAQGRFLFGV